MSHKKCTVVNAFLISLAIGFIVYILPISRAIFNEQTHLNKRINIVKQGLQDE